MDNDKKDLSQTPTILPSKSSNPNPMPSPDLPIAIIGGGLCGLALAIGLQERHVPFVLYEARDSFTEIGAGINVGPSALQSLEGLHPGLGALVHALATRNPPPHEGVFMLLRRGAPSPPSSVRSHPPHGRQDGDDSDGEDNDDDDDDDAAPIADLSMPGTGSMTLHRREFLAALAGKLEPGRTRFGRKLVRYVSRGPGEGVRLEFADGSVESAGAVVGADGIHSRVRGVMFEGGDGGAANPLSRAHYFDEGAYRAMVPMEELRAAVGGEIAMRSTVWLGPEGYIIMYPVNKGREVNLGVWVRRPGPWEGDGWVLRDQRGRMMEDMRGWGRTVRRILALFPDDVAFWAAHQHRYQPESVRDGRVLLIGDAAHAMPPHQGAGAATGLEDAYVLAEVLGEARRRGMADHVGLEAALRAVEEVRTPRSATIHRYSCEARDRWMDFHGKSMKGDELTEFLTETRRRLKWIWGVDMVGEAAKATARMEEHVTSTS